MIDNGIALSGRIGRSSGHQWMQNTTEWSKSKSYSSISLEGCMAAASRRSPSSSWGCVVSVRGTRNSRVTLLEPAQKTSKEVSEFPGK